MTMGIFDRFRSKAPEAPPLNEQARMLMSMGLEALAPSRGQVFGGIFDGDKFPGGFGATSLLGVDYTTLRMRSNQLFTENPAAAGIVRRLVTNEINKGLTPESVPDGSVVGLSDDELTTWTENVETLFRLWGETEAACDWKRAQTFGMLQSEARRESIIDGDMLVVMRTPRSTGLPALEHIGGRHIQTPPMSTGFTRGAAERGNSIIHGVEIDKNKRHVAYFVRKDDGTYARVAAWGPKSGRRKAWLIYGSKRRLDEVRGMPLLGAMLQSFKELDRYKDAELRAAAINAIFAMVVQKTQAKAGTRPIGGAAVRKDSATVTDGDGSTRNFNVSEYAPGVVIDEMAHGEEVKSFDAKRPNVNYEAFNNAVVAGLAWSLEIPPEIVRLSFNNNYSASRAAINEFKIYLDDARHYFSTQYCVPPYRDWLLASALANIVRAPGFVEAWRRGEFILVASWTSSEWAGAIKPSVDREKEVKAYERMVKQGWITRDRAAKELTGMKFTTITRRLKTENALLVDASQPLIDAGLADATPPANSAAPTGAEAFAAEVIELVRDEIESEAVV